MSAKKRRDVHTIYVVPDWGNDSWHGTATQPVKTAYRAGQLALHDCSCAVHRIVCGPGVTMRLISIPRDCYVETMNEAQTARFRRAPPCECRHPFSGHGKTRDKSAPTACRKGTQKKGCDCVVYRPERR